MPIWTFECSSKECKAVEEELLITQKERNIAEKFAKICKKCGVGLMKGVISLTAKGKVK